MELNKLNNFDVDIVNDELKHFFNDIVNTLTYFIDNDEPLIGSVSINFINNTDVYITPFSL